MEAFDAAWLAAREPFDAAARSAQLAEAVGEVLSRHRVLHALDLATGTGANVRYLAPRLPLSQEWLLVDHDPRLIGAAAGAMSSWGSAHGFTIAANGDGTMMRRGGLMCRFVTECVDLLAETDLRESRVV